MYTFNKPKDLSPHDHPDIYPGPTLPYSFVYYQGDGYTLNETGTPDQYTFDLQGKTYSIKNFLAKEKGCTSLSHRFPVLCYGSNACIAQLSHKFSMSPKTNDFMIFLRGILKDSDVVYAACITKYGAVPAMIYPMRGAHCQVWIALMDVNQFKLFAATETKYDLYVLNKQKVMLDNGFKPKKCYIFNYDRALTFDGGLFRFPDIPGSHSAAQSIWEALMLEKLSSYFGLEREQFITNVREDKIFRHRIQDVLDLLSLRVQHPELKRFQFNFTSTKS